MNVNSGHGKLLIMNCFLLIMLFFYGLCYIVPQDLFFKETVTGLKYRKIFSPLIESARDYCGEENGFFLIERKVSYGKYCLEHPSQFFYMDNHYPYVIDIEEIKNDHVWNRYFELLFIIPVGCEYEAKVPIGDIYPISKIKQLRLEIDGDISPDSIVNVNVKKIKYYPEQDIEQINIDYAEMISKLKQKHFNILSHKIEKDLYINGINYISKTKKNGYMICIKKLGTGEKINKGDEISIQYKYYKHYRDSKVYRTNIEEVAKENDIYDCNILYEPYKFHVGEHTIPCLDVIFMDEDLDLYSGTSVVVYDFTHSKFFGDMGNIVVLHCDIEKNSKLESDTDKNSDYALYNNVENEQQTNEELKENLNHDQIDDKNYGSKEEQKIEVEEKSEEKKDYEKKGYEKKDGIKEENKNEDIKAEEKKEEEKNKYDEKKGEENKEEVEVQVEEKKVIEKEKNTLTE